MTKLREYSLEEDAPEEREITKTFLEGISEETLRHVDETIFSMLDEESLAIWAKLKESFPMIARVAVYTYSPSEAFEERLLLLSRWAADDRERGDLRNPQALQDVAFLAAIARQPGIKERPIADFLKQADRDFSKVLQADVRKAAGHPDPIEKLRENWKRVETLESGTKIIFDRSPFDRIEYLDLPDKVEIHYHVLDDSNPNDLFVDADAHLVEWFQWLDEIRVSDKQAWVYIYGYDGELVKPPGAHQNPFSFNLLEKYKGLVYSAAKNVIPDPDPGQAWTNERQDTVLTSGDAVVIFLEKVIPSWKGDRPPAAHFSKTLPWRLRDLLRKEAHINRKTETLNEETTPAPAAPEEGYNNDLKDRLRTHIDLLARESTNPAERLVLKIKRQIVDSDGEEKTLTDQQIAERLKAETGKTVSRQYIQKIRTAIDTRLKELLEP